ncbi:MAG: hypothetical protein ABIP17_08365 [Ilumatobacteraceae bacterium]
MIDEVVVTIRYPLRNEYGEVSEANVIIATFTPSSVHLIVFDNIDRRDILNLSELEYLFVHPMFQY